MHRVVLPATLLLLLAGCGTTTSPIDMPFGLGNTTANRPEPDGYTMRRVLGAEDDVAPLQTEPGNVWPGAEAPRRSVFEPEEPRQRPRTQRGSSTPPTANTRQDPDLRIPAQRGARAAPPARTGVGQAVNVPDAPGSTTTGGTANYQTYQTPGGGSGVTIPNTDGTMTVIGSDGQVRTVPRQ